MREVREPPLNFAARRYLAAFDAWLQDQDDEEAQAVLDQRLSALRHHGGVLHRMLVQPVAESERALRGRAA